MAAAIEAERGDMAAERASMSAGATAIAAQTTRARAYAAPLYVADAIDADTLDTDTETIGAGWQWPQARQARQEEGEMAAASVPASVEYDATYGTEGIVETRGIYNVKREAPPSMLEKPQMEEGAEQEEPKREQQQERANAWFAKVPAAVIRDRRLTASARDVLIALLLYTDSEGRCYPRQNTIAEDLGIARQEVNRRLRLLRETGYVTIESGKVRGAACVYHIHLTPLQSAPSRDATDADKAQDARVNDTVSPPAKKRARVNDTVSGVNDGVSPGERNFGHPNITDPSNRSSDQNHDADASQVPAKPVRAKKPRPKPKLTEEQLAAHQAEQAWCAELMRRVAEEAGVKTLPIAGREKMAAKWFYQELLGVEDGIAKVLACRKITLLSPFRRTKGATLFGLQEFFPEYRRDPPGYRKEREREAEVEERKQEMSSRHARAAPSEPAERRYTTPDQVSPWKKIDH